MSLQSPLSKKDIILDTGPLIYLLLYNYAEIGESAVEERINQVSGHEFSKSKSKILAQRLAGKNLFVTSHTLAEVSNHIESDTKYNISVEDFLNCNSKFIEETINEEHMPVELVLDSALGLKFGIPDCSINELLDKGVYTLVSSDDEIMEGAGEQGHEIVPLGSLLMKP